MPATTVEVWDSTNSTKIADLNLVDDGQEWAPKDVGLRRQLVEDGGGHVVLPYGHPNRLQVNYRRVLRIYEDKNGDKVLRGAFSVDTIEWVDVAESPSANKTTRFEGDGLLSRWNDFIILPWIDIAYKPVTENRVFNWASPPLPIDDWQVGGYKQERLTSATQRPVGYTDPVSEWISPYEEAPSHPTGFWYARRLTELDDPTRVALFFTCDDGVIACLDGATLDDEMPEPPSEVWWYTHRAAVELPAGLHLYAFKCRNDGGPTALLVSGWSADNTGLITPLFISEAGGVEDPNFLDAAGEWLLWTDPEPPGFTAGHIVRLVLEEAQGRGAMVGWTLGFTDTHDTAGNPWPTIPELAIPVGHTGRDLLAALEPWVDLGVSDEGLELLMWDKAAGRGEASSAELTEGVNLRRLSHRGVV